MSMRWFAFTALVTASMACSESGTGRTDAHLTNGSTSGMGGSPMGGRAPGDAATTGGTLVDAMVATGDVPRSGGTLVDAMVATGDAATTGGMVVDAVIAPSDSAPVGGMSGNVSPFKISDNPHYFATQDGKPFFWLGDTGWLLFTKLTREATETYLENRRQKGFNVIQVMVIHGLNDRNVYGDQALSNGKIASPLTTPGSDPTDPAQYDFWDHVDYAIDRAASKGMMMGLVCIWGSNISSVSIGDARIFATWLANRFKSKPNIVWINGGDVDAGPALATWKAIGESLRKTDPDHLITFHPRGRMQSSDWFHPEAWLDFHMFESGHRTYAQDDTARKYGEDNWRYVKTDYELTPIKPTLDGEPSYEGIPQGLHDTSNPYWNENDVRRYAYWAVFAGAAGHTYGNNSVFQFYQPGSGSPFFGAKKSWTQAIDDPGSAQMTHLKSLMLSFPYFDRIPDQTLVAGKQGTKYDYVIATRGETYALAYTYSGQTMQISMGKIQGAEVKASWFDPRTGKHEPIGNFSNASNTTQEFNPPGEVKPGNDWVLVLESK